MLWGQKMDWKRVDRGRETGMRLFTEKVMLLFTETEPKRPEDSGTRMPSCPPTSAYEICSFHVTSVCKIPGS